MKQSAQPSSDLKNYLNESVGKKAGLTTLSNSYQRVTFSPTSFKSSYKKSGAYYTDSVGDEYVDNTDLRKSDILLDSKSKASVNLMAKENLSKSLLPSYYNDKETNAESTKAVPKADYTGFNLKKKRNSDAFKSLKTKDDELSNIENADSSNKKSLKIDTNFSHSGKMFNTLKNEASENGVTIKSAKDASSWKNGSLYQSTVQSAQHSNSHQQNQLASIVSNMTQFPESTKDKLTSPSKYKRDVLIRTYTPQDGKKRPLSSAHKFLAHNKDAEKSLVDPATREVVSKVGKPQQGKAAINDSIKYKYKVAAAEEENLDVSTPKDTFQQLLSEYNTKAYDQQLLEIKSTLKSIRVGKEKSQNQNKIKEGDKLKGTLGSLVTQSQQPTQESELETPNSETYKGIFSQISNKDKDNSQLKTEESNKTPTLLYDEKPSKPSQPKPNISEKSRTSQNVKAKDQDLSKSQIEQSPPLRQMNAGLNRNVKYRKSRDFGKNKETEEETQNGNVSALKQAYAPYYTHNLKKHWTKANGKDYFCRLYRDHFHQIYQEMKICKSLKPVEPSLLNKKKVTLPKRESHKDMKTLLFDLDETLVHCNPTTNIPSDVVLPIKLVNGVTVNAGINIRPYAVECLKELSQYYEIIIFTASHSSYANVILDYLDPNNEYIHHRLFRESCMPTKEGVNVKDLRILKDRNLSDMVLIDNSGNSFGRQIDNGIPVAPFYDNKDDRELLDLIEYLKSIRSEPDLRTAVKQTFRLQAYAKYSSPKEVLDNIVLKN